MPIQSPPPLHPARVSAAHRRSCPNHATAPVSALPLDPPFRAPPASAAARHELVSFTRPPTPPLLPSLLPCRCASAGSLPPAAGLHTAGPAVPLASIPAAASSPVPAAAASEGVAAPAPESSPPPAPTSAAAASLWARSSARMRARSSSGSASASLRRRSRGHRACARQSSGESPSPASNTDSQTADTDMRPAPPSHDQVRRRQR